MIFSDINKRQQAGQKIGQLLQQADSELATKSNPSKIIDYLQQKHLGTPTSPSPDLMPNVVPGEKTKIQQLIRNNLSNLGSGELEPKGFQDLQKIKQAFDTKAKWDKSQTNAEVQVHRNFSRKISNMIKEGIPSIKKPYADYAKASATISQHGGGIGGLVHKVLTGGGVAGWLMREALLYPAVRSGSGTVMNLLNSSEAQSPTNIGFQGHL